MRTVNINTIRKIIAYVYLYIGFSYIIYYFYYHLRVSDTINEFSEMMFFNCISLSIYLLINHLIIKRTIKTNILLIFEYLLLFTELIAFVCILLKA